MLEFSFKNTVVMFPVFVKWKWHTAKYGDPILGIRALHLPIQVHTHTAVKHTHTVSTHPEQWAAIYAATPGEQLGDRCLAQGHRHGIEGGESIVHSTPPTDNPSRNETQTHKLSIMSPNHQAMASPRLPLIWWLYSFYNL